jgi:two-component system invasion response regulator UvrY
MTAVLLSSTIPLHSLGLDHLFEDLGGFELLDRTATPGRPPEVAIHSASETAADLATVTELAATCPVLVISAGGDSSSADRYLGAGARGFCHLSAPLETIVTAVREVAEGHRFLHLTMVTGGEASTAEPLSGREREVLEYIALGRTHDQIARLLGLSRHTVDTYIKRARRKLSAGNKADLTRAILSPGLTMDGRARAS